MRRLISLITIIFFLGFVGCANQKQNPNELKEKTTQAAHEMKQSAQEVAEGIREGLSRDKPLNLNMATKDQLSSLQLSEAEADAVIAARPYYSPDELVKRKVLSKEEYERIADRVTTAGSKPNPAVYVAQTNNRRKYQ